jgi:hypothetical protein
MQLQFTVESGSASIDDLFVDPFSLEVVGGHADTLRRVEPFNVLGLPVKRSRNACSVIQSLSFVSHRA